MPSGPRIRANNVYGLTTDNPLSAVATTFNSTGLAMLPAVSSAHAVVVLDPKRIFGEPELVIVTAHPIFNTSATITRAAYGTLARAHPMNTAWAHVPMDEDFCEICTTVTHPSNPYIGQMIYETDSLLYKSWNGSAWVDFGGGGANIFQDPNPPGGPVVGTLWLDTDEGAQTGLSSIIAYASSTVAQSGIGSETDITGTIVTVTVPAGRRIRVVGRIEVGSPSTNLNAFLLVKEGATEIGRAAAVVNTSTESTLTAETIISPSAGSHTYKLTLQTNTGTINISNVANSPNYILVEDITGSLWPVGTSVGAATIASEAWTSYVPALTNLTLGNGTVTGAYIKLGRTVSYRFEFTLGGTSAVGTDPRFSLPILPITGFFDTTDFPVGIVTFLDAGIVGYSGMVIGSGTPGVVRCVRIGGSGSGNVTVTSTNPFTFATGDKIQATGTYEAAS